MLMHRVTFPTPAWVSLDAAGVLTDGAAETEGGGGVPKIPAHQLFLLPRPFVILQNEKKVKVWERVEMLSRGFYHKLAG